MADSNQQSIKAAAKAVIQQKAGPPQPSARMVFQQEVVQGPLPSPEILRLYGEVVKDGAERIFRMAEGEQAHRHKMERRFLAITWSGQLGGVLLGLTGVVGGLLLVAYGKELSGFGAFFCGLAPLVTAYFWDRRKESVSPQSAERKPSNPGRD